MLQVLQFSGGLDSLACLHVLRDASDMVVLTASTDGEYPQRAAYLAQVAAAYPRLEFHHVKTDRELDRYGRPVDVVPLRYTAMGMLAAGQTGARYQDAFSCCNRALWAPLDREARRLGAEVIIRGQRDSDSYRAPVRDGEKLAHLTYRFPLHDWTRDEVLKYVEANVPELVPESYRVGERTSRDCWDCTAYLRDNRTRISNLPMPKWQCVNDVLVQWREDVNSEMEAL
jgi:phosphoadenosine phosphosulfate reductase